MELNQTPNPSRQGPLERASRIDITRPNRDGIRRATVDIAEIRGPNEHDFKQLQEAATSREGDRIELSETAIRLAAGEVDGDARRAHVEELRRQYLEGSLNSPERVERAAVQMLSDA